MRFVRTGAVVALFSLAAACQRAPYAATAHLAPATSQPVGAAIAADPAVAALIAPYHDQVTRQMAEVLGTAPVPIVKTAGESPLNNFVADLQRERASQFLGQPMDLGVMTNGGLRASLPAGPITLGHVFELMPFENELVVLDASGGTVQKLFEYAAHIRMPISGATYAVTFDGLPTDIMIQGQPFNPAADRLYSIAISDYLAGGGDNLLFLKPVEPRHTGILLRTAIADHIRALTAAGQLIVAKVDGRVEGN